MKRTILIMLVVFFTFPVLAQQQNTFFEQLTEKYANKDGFSASMITKDMFDLYLKKKNIDKESPVFEALKNLNKILVVSQNSFSGKIIGASAGVALQNEPKDNLVNELHETILNHYKTDGYTLLKTEKRMGEDVKVYLRKNQDIIESLALVTGSENSTSLIELQGDIDLAAVADLNQALNLRGLENLYKINNSGNFGYSGNTGYVTVDKQKIEEMVARQRELFEKQRNLTDEQREKIELQAQLQAEKQMQMAEKYREMAERYQREPIFLNYPGDTNTVYFIDGKKVNAKEIKELNKEKIESVEIKKSGKDDDKTTIKIKTK